MGCDADEVEESTAASVDCVDRDDVETDEDVEFDDREFCDGTDEIGPS